MYKKKDGGFLGRKKVNRWIEEKFSSYQTSLTFQEFTGKL